MSRSEEPRPQHLPEFEESERPRPHGDTLEDGPGTDVARERGERPDRPSGPTGDMDQPGMNPEDERE